MDPIDNDADFINASDIPQRIAELQGADCGSELEGDDGCDNVNTCPSCYGEAEEELAQLTDLMDTLKDIYGSARNVDMNNPTLIRESYFGEYARKFAEDMIGSELGILDGFIDWEGFTSYLQTDYTDIDFGGVTYWVHG
jgi:hypothetical protein